jgi:hypothetical protein
VVLNTSHAAAEEGAVSSSGKSGSRISPCHTLLPMLAWRKRRYLPEEA